MKKALPTKLLRLLAALIAPASLLNADSLWIEAESLATPPAAADTNYSKPEWLSGKQVIALNLNPKEIEAAIPESGLILSYPITVEEAGSYTLWNRVGFENIRSAFEWRVNNGAWTLNSQVEQPITNIQELAYWNPMGWTQLGTADLPAGENTLEIRLNRQLLDPNNPEKGYAKLHYISDVFHITNRPFQPNFHLRPGTELNPDEAAAAAEHSFVLEDDSAAPRQSLDLSGLWQFAAYDEIGEISEEFRVAGAAEYPELAALTWNALLVPSDRNTALPAARFSHRFILRTIVDIPDSMEGAGYQLNFECLNLIQTLFVNGQRIGDFDTAKSRWLVDITSAIEPGTANEILLVVKDTYYGLAPDKGNGIRRSQYFPNRVLNGNQGVTNRFDYPVAYNHNQAGILDTVTLIATRAPVYVSDTFVKTFPTTKQLITVDTTLTNSSSTAATATIRQRIETWPAGEPVATVGHTELSVAAGATATATLSTSSEPLDLWWIYDPTLYKLITEVSLNGKVVDCQTTRFGNREWEVRGNQFYLNGIKQNLRQDLTHYNGSNNTTPLNEIVADWQDNGMNMFRRRYQFPWNGMSPSEILSWMDEIGMPVRMNAGTFDGQVASYRLVEGSGKDRTARRALFDRWHAQIMNGVDTWKNHPSVFIWELDNELVYINARNSGLLNEVEPEFTKVSNDVLAFDPTRSTVIGGGRALRDESLPTYGVHYFEVDDREYPDEAYTGIQTSEIEGNDRTRPWAYDFDKKPTFFSETAFLPGRNPSQFAAFGGEITFLGKQEAKPAIGLYVSWIAEGYRWKGYAANNVWFSKDFTDGSYTYAWQPVAILRREWNKTFAPSQQVARTLRVYNDLPDTRPITATWTLEIAGKTITSETKEFTVAPGTYEPWNVTVPMPADADARTEGRIILTATRAGETVFTHDLPVVLHPEAQPTAIELDGPLVVWDPSGEALARLRATGYQNIQSAQSLSEVPDSFGLLVVGRNALSQEDATNRRWTALASLGNRILILEQEHPLHFQATPANMEPSGYTGRMAFSQNLSHPIFTGLEQEDLSLWGPDHIVYQNALRKPTRGAVSLVQCDDQLGYTALALSPIDEGLLVMNQLTVASKLDSEIIARQLFDNMVAFTGTYQKVTRPVITDVQDPLIAKTLGAIGVNSAETTDPVAALSEGGSILIVEGTAENLAPLAAAPKKLETFWANGGYLYVKNITPDSLAAFNTIVGYNHILRPFREELVRLPVPANPLTAGLTQRDVVMGSGKRIQSWNRDEWPSDDAFDTIVDLNDIAPFAEFPSPSAFGYSATGPGNDQWPLNVVNGYSAAAHWRMVFTIGLNQENQSNAFELKLPHEETVIGLNIMPNRTFRDMTKLRVVFDNDPATTQELEVGPDLVSNLVLEPHKAKTISIQVIDTNEDHEKSLSGIDNFSLIVERPEGFAEDVRPMLNIGGLVEYPRGQGGVILDQYVIRQSEPNPVNAEKKRTLISTLLRNIGADLGGAKTAVAGFNLQYTPLSLEGFANLYLTTQQGWSANGGDLSALPRGDNTFADVRYNIRDFTTSPLESAVTLKHPKLKSNATSEEVIALPIDSKVDSLFFLHTFLETRTWKSSWNNKEEPELFQYVVHYEDGTTHPIVITLNDGVASWLQGPEVTTTPKAEIAWSGPEVRGKSPTLYQFQWNNPFPAKKVLSIDLTYAEKGKDYGAPALLGITVARVVK